MNNPIFTVIITTYRRQEYLRKAIDSVLFQNMEDYECLVINDYPPDNRAISALVQNLNDKRIRLIESVQNRGGNYCRNIGINSAKGQYVAFLDDDDIWFPDKLSSHYKQHQKTGAELVYSGYIRKNREDPETEALIVGLEVPDDIPGAMFAGKFSIGTTSSVSLKRSAIPDLPFDERLVSFQDWDAWLSLILSQQHVIFSHLPQPLLYFMQHDKERTSKSADRREKGLHQIVQKYGGRQEMRGFYYKELMNVYILKAIEYSGSLREQKTYLLKKFIRQPGLWLRRYPFRRMVKYLLLGK